MFPANFDGFFCFLFRVFPCLPWLKSPLPNLKAASSVSFTTTFKLSPIPFWRMCSTSSAAGVQGGDHLGVPLDARALLRISSICIGVSRRR